MVQNGVGPGLMGGGKPTSSAVIEDHLNKMRKNLILKVENAVYFAHMKSEFHREPPGTPNSP